MKITKGKIARAQKVVLYGPEGIGKSTFAAMFPEPLFIDTEGSTSNMDVARLDKPSSWTMLEQQIEFVKNNRPCKTLIIDTIDWAERLAIEFVISRSQKTSITSFGYGEGFIQLEEEFGRFLNKLTDLIEVGINVILTAHAKIAKFEQPDEMGAYDRWELKLGNKTTAKTAALTKEWADMVLFMNYKTFSVATDDKGKKFKGQGGKRTIYTSHNPAWDAKNRHNLPNEFTMDYSHIAHIFDNQDQVKTVKPEVINNSRMQTKDAPQDQLVEPSLSELNDNDISKPQKEELTEKIPKALADLMKTNKVTVDEIKEVVGMRGYYPEDTPIENYEADFIKGVLVGAWEQVFGMIKENRLNSGEFVPVDSVDVGEMPFL